MGALLGKAAVVFVIIISPRRRGGGGVVDVHVDDDDRGSRSTRGSDAPPPTLSDSRSSTRLTSTVAFAVTMPGRLRRHPTTPTLVPGACLAPGARLASTVAFAVTVPGRLPLPVPISRRRSRLLRSYPVASDRVRPVTSRPELSRFETISRLDFCFNSLGQLWTVPRNFRN